MLQLVPGWMSLGAPFEASLPILLSIVAWLRCCRYRAPGRVPVIAANVEIRCHRKVICGAKEPMG
jgi:hypothetical protein